jgi:hypothetical protein
MEKSGLKWAQEGAGRKKAELERELENLVSVVAWSLMMSEPRLLCVSRDDDNDEVGD